MRSLAPFLVTLLALAAAQDCLAPFQLVGEKCYYFSHQPLSRLFSEAQCQQIAPDGTEATLAVVDDCHQLGALWKYIVEVLNRPENHWIGGSDEFEEGEWTWPSGDAVPSGSPLWLPGQPDGGKDENHLCLSTKGYFADESGSTAQQYVCQLV